VADISLLQGHRNKKDQTTAFESGHSEVEWRNSKHNSKPSLAVDFSPYPKPKNQERLWAALGYIAGRIIQTAYDTEIEIRWGGLWRGDGNFVRRQFLDGWHLEIVEKEREDESN